jgi:hypothetical protein
MFQGGNKGSFTTLQHGEYTLTYIHVPQNFKSIPSGTYCVPSALSVPQRNKLLGRLDRKDELVTRFFVKVLPRDLSQFLATVGAPAGMSANVARANQGIGVPSVPLLTRIALGRVKEGLPWPAGFPALLPPPEIQILQPPPMAAAPAAPHAALAPAAPAPGVRNYFMSSDYFLAIPCIATLLLRR